MRPEANPVPGFEPVAEPGFGYGWVRSEAEEWVRSALAEGCTLHEDARVRRKPEDGATPLRGRGAVRRIEPVPDGPDGTGRTWVVRHYYRGGGMRWLGDRYLAVGEPRPLVELRASISVAGLGVRTPPVIAAAVYPTGLFVRGDLVTEYLADTEELATFLFGPGRREERERIDALERVGAWIRDFASKGLEHPDLNAKNILIDNSDSTADPILLDLDRCRVDSDRRSVQAESMLGRLRRSLRRFEDRSAEPLTTNEWKALG